MVQNISHNAPFNLVQILHTRLYFLRHAHSDWTRASVHGAIVILPAIGSTYSFPKVDGEETIVLGKNIKIDNKGLILIIENCNFLDFFYCNSI